MESLVSTDWLADRFSEPDISVVDCSWHMPATGCDARAEFAAEHIAHAVFLDIDQLSDRTDPAPHMLPSADAFGAAMEALGVGRGDRIIVYDDSSLRTAARGWFMFRHFGAERVAILDGGFRKWLAEGLPTASGDGHIRLGARFEARSASDVATKQELTTSTGLVIADARSRGRFEGSEPDPRPGVAAGHIPGARNVPFASLYKADGTFRDRAELAQMFSAAGVDPQAPFVASCGSGVTANSLIFAAHLLGDDTARLYDGSWGEWGADPATPKALGPA